MELNNLNAQALAYANLLTVGLATNAATGSQAKITRRLSDDAVLSVLEKRIQMRLSQQTSELKR